MSQIFVQTYEASSLAELQEKLLVSLARAQGTYAIRDIQVSHAHGTRCDADTGGRADIFSALVVITVV